MPTQTRRSRWLRGRLLPFILAAIVGSTPGCWASEPDGGVTQQHDSNARSKIAVPETPGARFVRNLVARANAQCRCSPLEGQSSIAACVVQQATTLLEEALHDVTIAGPRPALDTAQVASLSQYLRENHADVPAAGRCELDVWMRAVAAAAGKRPRSRGTVVSQQVFRTDQRHPSAWSAVGFMAASTNPLLTTSAAPYDHYSVRSFGSQVWVSLATDMAGIWWVLANHLSQPDAPHVCLGYDSAANEFRDETGDCGSYGHPGRFSLRVGYVYEGVTTVYRPSTHPIPDEREVLSLGFRPTKYRGVVTWTTDGNVRGLTKSFDITYANSRCLAVDRPAYTHDATPFGALKQDVVVGDPGRVCSASPGACLACAALTTPAAQCRPL